MTLALEGALQASAEDMTFTLEGTLQAGALQALTEDVALKLEGALQALAYSMW